MIPKKYELIIAATMSFPDTLKAKVGPVRYRHIEDEAQKELALALAMPMKNKFDANQHYSPRLEEFA